VATFSSVTRTHILQAIAEHDARGGEEFLSVYGFEPLPGYGIVHEGSRYDLRAVLAVAHRHATGRLATPEEFASSLAAAVAILRKRGFEVVGPPTPVRAAPTRATAGSRPVRATRAPTRVTRQEVAPSICPTCSMALPATGICDDCG
jgi:hypothetical protein